MLKKTARARSLSPVNAPAVLDHAALARAAGGATEESQPSQNQISMAVINNLR